MNALNQPPSVEEPPLQIRLLQMIWGGWVSQCIHVAAKLGISDYLQDGPRTCAEIAEKTGAHQPTLQRLLRALASFGIFEETRDGLITLTPLASLLQTGVPGSLKHAAVMFGEEWHRGAWSHLLKSVQTGQPAFEQVNNLKFFEFMAMNPEISRIFGEAMTSISGDFNEILAKSYDFGTFKRVVDVGGGHGSLMVTLLKQYPQVNGVIVDLPPVMEGAKEYVRQAGMADRCECVAGNFFESVPADGDGYVLKFIIHDWADEQAVTILRNCRSAMNKGAKLLLMEQVLPPGNEPALGKLSDIEMLVMLGGKERTEQEFRQLLATAGFQLARVVPTQSPLSILEAVSI
ncbi:MAG: methyltransferase [Clostridia bacterium]